MSEKPLVTVVIPSWNRLPLLKEAIASVMSQTYGQWELIVVDDGSTDGTSEQVRALGENRIHVVECSHTGNVGRLRNIGAAAGSGELIAFLDSDDLWLPRKLEIQIQALESSPAGWCYTRFELVDLAGRPVPFRAGEFRPISGPILRELLTSQASVAMPSLLVRRSLFDELGGFSEEPRCREDFDFYLRLAARSETVAVPDLLVHVREHAERSAAACIDAHERTARAYERFLSRDPDPVLASLARSIWAHHLADAAGERLAMGELRQAWQFFLRAVRRGASLTYSLRALARRGRTAVKLRFASAQENARL